MTTPNTTLADVPGLMRRATLELTRLQTANAELTRQRDALAEALRDIADCAHNPEQVFNGRGGVLGRIESVACAALALAEGSK